MEADLSHVIFHNEDTTSCCLTPISDVLLFYTLLKTFITCRLVAKLLLLSTTVASSCDLLLLEWKVTKIMDGHWPS